MQDRRDGREKSDKTFEVPKTSNFGPRTAVPFAPRPFPACLAMDGLLMLRGLFSHDVAEEVGQRGVEGGACQLFDLL
jgi:hypothetical protein